MQSRAIANTGFICSAYGLSLLFLRISAGQTVRVPELNVGRGGGVYSVFCRAASFAFGLCLLRQNGIVCFVCAYFNGSLRHCAAAFAFLPVVCRVTDGLRMPAFDMIRACFFIVWSIYEDRRMLFSGNCNGRCYVYGFGM